ncbi:MULTISPECIES: TIGR02391 family protein [Methylotenera]|uniref:TIGR02391 family protein n=1 Tax=Methylotenera TaxID=359407 RepID=UPI000362DFDC|nr:MULTISPECIES: TIGR02391 family protein [Methylotenera]
MDNSFDRFQSITREVPNFTHSRREPTKINQLHPYEERNVHPEIDTITRALFDNGHYSHATFEAFKYIDKKVQKLSSCNESGYKLMTQAFNEASPLIKLTNLSNTSEKDEQKGYMFIFTGAVMAIRNPRGHEVSMKETPTQCLDHISLASLLLRRLSDVK